MKKFIFGLALLASLFFADHAFAYTVEDGDTMTEIAQEHGMTLEELAKANPQVKNLDLIVVGQYINTDDKKSTHEFVKGSGNSQIEHVVKEEETVTKSIQITNRINLTKNEIDLLARIVRAEAQAEPFEGKVAVAAVVLNRVESKKFPNSIKEVIYQRGQFQPVRNGQINKRADEESIRAVYAALSDMRYIVGNSLFFYNPAIATSRWLDSRQTTVVIGNHVFKN